MNMFLRGGRPALIAFIVLIVLFVGTAASTAVFHRTPWQQVSQTVVPDPQSLFGQPFVRVLVVGLDYDYDAKDQETSAHSRSDIIMAVNVDFKHRRIKELSVPRDMVATMPDGSQAKINEAQSQGGIAESQRVVAQWLGIPGFDRYIVLRINTMKDLINAIGGVDVYVKTSDCLRYKTSCAGGHIDYDDSWGHLHVHLTEGLQHLSGEQAVGYARFRHDWCSDPCRIMRQQEVAKAIVQRLSGDKFNTLVHIGSLVGVLNRDVQTDLTAQEQLSMAYALRGLNLSSVKMAQVPYVNDVDLPGYGDSLIADEGEKRRLVRDLLMP